MKPLLALAALLALAFASPDKNPTTTVRCGSRGLPPCSYGSTCVASPSAKCGPEVDRPGYCSKLAPVKPKPKPTPSRKPPKPKDPIDCGGFRPNPPSCPAGQICTIPPSSICYNGTVTDCAGLCVGQPCGGLNPNATPCPKGQMCVSRPPPDRPSFIDDSPGICVFSDTYCAGFTGRENCPDNWQCVDRPDDSCDPTGGGADCPGICSFNKGVGGDAGGDGPADP